MEKLHTSLINISTTKISFLKDILLKRKKKLFNYFFLYFFTGSNPSLVSSTNPREGHRNSLIHASVEKKAKKVRFFINSDKFFKGATIAVSSEKFRTFDKLLEHMTRIMCNQVTLPHGVRYIFGLDGKNVESVEELLHGSNYVCSSNSTFKRMDYSKIAQEQENHWNKMKRETCYLGKKYLL